MPWFIVTAVYLLARKLFVESGAAFGFWNQNFLANMIHSGGLSGAMTGVAMTVMGYLRLWIWPQPLSNFHLLLAPVNGAEWTAFILCAVLILIVITATMRFPQMRWGWIWFFIFMFPVLNIIPIGGMFNERHLYLPSVGLAAIAAWLFDRLIEKTSARLLRGLFFIAAAILILAGSRAAYSYSAQWLNNDALWRRAHEIYPQAAYPLDQMGKSFYEAGDLINAAESFRQSADLEQNPERKAEIRRKAAQGYGIKRQFDRSIAQYRQLLREKPDHWLAWFELGWTYYIKGDLDQAEAVYRDLLAHNPDYARGYYGLAHLAAARGQTLEAKEQIAEAMNHHPDAALTQVILKNLGVNPKN